MPVYKNVAGGNITSFFP